MKGLIKMIFIAFALPVMFVLLFYLIGNLLQKEVIISSLSSEVYQAADEIDISEKLLRRAIKEMEELDESKLSDLIKGIERNSERNLNIQILNISNNCVKLNISVSSSKKEFSSLIIWDLFEVCR